MEKWLLLILFGLWLVMVSCNFLNKGSESDIVPEDDLSGQKIVNGATEPHEQRRFPQGGNSPPRQPDTIDHAEREKPVTHYDIKTLDDRVIALAAKLGVDSKTYRMLIRTEPDGTKVYRMLGRHVIVNPDGTEVILPDEI